VNFWTLTCINGLRQEPYVRSWSRAYRGDVLVVIGMHTPEFSFQLLFCSSPRLHSTASSSSCSQVSRGFKLDAEHRL
jgi:hypothetical protein